MNLGRVKSFLIFLFLAINIYLIVSLVMSSAFRIDDSTITDTINILENHNISIDKNIIPQKTKNLNNIETTNIIYTDTFKKNKNYADFEIKGNSFSYTAKDDSLYKMSDRKIQKNIKKLLEDCEFNSEYMKFSEISKDDKSKNFDILCYVKDYCVFDSRITVQITKSKLVISGTWHEPQTTKVVSNLRTRKTTYITSILIDLCENKDFKDSKKITNIEFGYMSGTLYGNAGYIAATALPYYCLTDEKGNKYYYDATDGTYNSSLSTSNSQ